MTVIRCWTFLVVPIFCWQCSQYVVHSFPVNHGVRTVERGGATMTWSSVGILTLLWISVASAVSLVTVVALCLCCYPRSSAEDSDSDDQNKLSDDQYDAGETGRDERKQLTVSQQSKTSINLPWPMSELSTISVKSIQPDQFGQSSVNKALGVTSSQLHQQQQQLQSGQRWQMQPSQTEYRTLGAGAGLAEDYASSRTREAEGSSEAYAEQLLCFPESPAVAPQLGRIQFRVSYDFDQYILTLKLINAVDLPAKDFSGTSDPYVKIYLLPDRKHKLLSNIKRKCLNPFWNETFTFEGFPYEKLVSKSLYLQVLDYDRFSRDDPIGEVIIPVSDLDLTTTSTLWKDLQPSKGHVGQLGELLVSLCYNPKQSTVSVGILRARLLKAKDINGSSDPYVKVWLLRDGKKIEKKKTVVHQKTLSPVFNSNFNFNVPFEHIRRTSLLISVMDHDFIGVNELIGQILLGCKSSPMEAKHWNEMLTKPRQIIEKWHMLKDLG